MLLMGIAFGLTMGSIIHFFKVEPFIVTLMGMFFARGMAYVITLEGVPIIDVFYRWLALTKVHIPLIDKAYVYPAALVGPVLAAGSGLPRVFHPVRSHGVCDRQ